jgi:dTDP-4-amino-4,6-dideoxygalactose transaminase
MITALDPLIVERIRQLRSHGASISDFTRHEAKGLITEEYTVVGYNYRLTDIQAAVGVTQMDRLPAILERHAEVSRRYSAALTELDEVEAPFVPVYATHTFQSYMVRLTSRCRLSRDDVLRRMIARGISCRRGIAAIHLEPAYRQIAADLHLQETEQAARATMFLPIFAEMADEQVSFVLDSMKNALVP